MQLEEESWLGGFSVYCPVGVGTAALNNWKTSVDGNSSSCLCARAEVVALTALPLHRLRVFLTRLPEALLACRPDAGVAGPPRRPGTGKSCHLHCSKSWQCTWGWEHLPQGMCTKLSGQICPFGVAESLLASRWLVGLEYGDLERSQTYQRWGSATHNSECISVVETTEWTRLSSWVTYEHYGREQDAVSA